MSCLLNQDYVQYNLLCLSKYNRFLTQILFDVRLNAKYEYKFV